MKRKKEILKILILNAHEWKSHNKELKYLISIEPKKCVFRHHLPFHLRGYGQCHRDWEKHFHSIKQMKHRQYWLCFGLAQALGDKELSAIWEPKKYADMIPVEVLDEVLERGDNVPENIMRKQWGLSDNEIASQCYYHSKGGRKFITALPYVAMVSQDSPITQKERVIKEAVEYEIKTSKQVVVAARPDGTTTYWNIFREVIDG